MKLAAILFLGLAACSAPRQGIITRGGARVFAAPEAAERLHAIADRYEPQVIQLLGTAWTAPYTIEVCEPGSDRLGSACDQTKEVKIAPRALERDDLAKLLVHELVHVHAIAHWNDLPYAVQEGLAYWVSGVIVDGVRTYSGPQPSHAALRQALTITREDYQSMDDTRAVNQAATWLASWLIDPARITRLAYTLE